MKKGTVQRVREAICQPVLGVLIRDAWFSRLMMVIAIGLLAASAAGIHVWPCPFIRITNYPCPGCGLTRSVRALVRGDFSAAMNYNAFGFVAIVVLSSIAVAAVLPDKQRRAFADRLANIERRTGLAVILFVLMIGYWIARLASGDPKVLELLRGG